MLTAGANLVMVLIYALISIEMILAIVRGRQLLSNPLLTATAAVFVTCTIGHGFHLEHATLAAWGLYGQAGYPIAEAVRATFGDPRLVVWDAFTAAVAIYFYTLRSRFAIVYRGAALCEDMAKRELEALEIHDNVVQGLVVSKMHLDTGDRAAAIRALDETLVASRGIITGLLGQEGTEVSLGAGDLRRAQPAGGHRP